VFLVDRDPNEDGVLDSPSPTISKVNLRHDGTQLIDGHNSTLAGLSSDGSVIAFTSNSQFLQHDTNSTHGDVYVRDLDSTCPQPMAFCEGSDTSYTDMVNSTGVAAYLDFSGSASVSANDISLEVNGGVPGKVGIFFYGSGNTAVSFGNGFRCVSGGSGGLFRIYPPLSMDSVGHAVLPSFLDKKPCDTGPGAVTPGAAWNFQFWYRDPGSTQGSTFNLSNALRIAFCS
jgi:hypothetical protein